LVGFQTHLKFGAQKELLKLIPGLENCEIVRYGVMHRNTYMNSPKLLNTGFQLKTRPNLFFAGQMTGVEGYVESAASGLIAGINMARYLEGLPLLRLNSKTAIGALSRYVTNETIADFVPMNVNFGIFDELEGKVYKKARKDMYAERALAELKNLLDEVNNA
jgi:methylenetetrahydrofolate--tRNA-(uracil-5-)-methyltransferase